MLRGDVSSLRSFGSSVFVLAFVLAFAMPTASVHAQTAAAGEQEEGFGVERHDRTLRQAAESDRELPLDRLRLPDGFTVSVWAAGVENARSLTRGAQGTIFVGTRTAGKVYAVVDEDGDGRAEWVYTLAEGLNMPNGVAFRDGALYVAEVHRVLRFDAIEDRLDDPPEPVVVSERFPPIRHHGWKFIAFGPDDRLYVPVGAPCNICDSKDEVFNTITSMKPDGSDFRIDARGVRNTVGFTWHPETSALWFTDNGRDWMGDDLPPDELNVLSSQGEHFGYPFCHGTGISDPAFGSLRPCSDFTSPALDLGPHVAALGLRFYTGTAFPEEYRGQIFLAERGSWNRSAPIGYQVTLVRFGKDGLPISAEPFLEGFLGAERAWGRPVDLEVLPDGSMLVSDDTAGAIYRITADSAAAPTDSSDSLGDGSAQASPNP